MARLITEMSTRPNLAIEELARLVGRGARSAVGAHGFALGGFLVEAGKLDVELQPFVLRDNQKPTFSDNQLNISW